MNEILLVFLVARPLLHAFVFSYRRPPWWVSLAVQTPILTALAELIGRAFQSGWPSGLALVLSTLLAGVVELLTRPRFQDQWDAKFAICAEDAVWLLASTVVSARTISLLAGIGVEGFQISLAVTAMCVALEMALRGERE